MVIPTKFLLSLHLLEELKNADVNHQGIQAFCSLIEELV